MSNPPQQPLILTPAPGVPGPVLYLNPYTGSYTPSRSYALRMQRGFSAGLPQQAARRSGPAGAGMGEVSESQRRRDNFLAKYGFEEVYWRRIQRKYIKPINEIASPAGQIDRLMVQQFFANKDVHGLDAGWLENRLSEKLFDMREYRQSHQTGAGAPGFIHFWADIGPRAFVPIEFWWYH